MGEARVYLFMQVNVYEKLVVIVTPPLLFGFTATTRVGTVAMALSKPSTPLAATASCSSSVNAIILSLELEVPLYLFRFCGS